MKLWELLLEKVNNVQTIVNRKDLIAILDALEIEPSQLNYTNCFIKAISEAIKIMTKLEISAKDLQAAVEKKNSNFDSDKVHPDQITGGLIVRSGDKLINFDLSYKMVNSTADIKKNLSKGIPVIISVRWNRAYYYPGGYFRNNSHWNDQEKLDDYKAQGASDEMIAKTKEGIMAYPSDEFIEKHSNEGDDTTHALLCVGYDASHKAFIVRDFLNKDALYKGFFKIEEKMFFDPKLKSVNASTVEAAIVVEVEQLDEKKRTSNEEIFKIIKVLVAKNKMFKSIKNYHLVQDYGVRFTVVVKDNVTRLDVKNAIKKIVDQKEVDEHVRVFGYSSISIYEVDEREEAREIDFEVEVTLYEDADD